MGPQPRDISLFESLGIVFFEALFDDSNLQRTPNRYPVDRNAVNKVSDSVVVRRMSTISVSTGLMAVAFIALIQIDKFLILEITWLKFLQRQ